ncbi:MAG: family 43 glycosylhydrolase [Bacteroidota bacterium]|nr:family 43 glycosylhydrolase [Bacteroidota bacterium]
MRLYKILFFLNLFLSGQLLFAQKNPIVRDIYTADPSGHVWADGRLYVYPSHDIDPPRGCDLMDKYHVYSTTDMVNWTDHGQIVEASDVPWAQPLDDNGKFMWAPDCAYHNGKYYFYFPHPNKSPWNSNWKIGIAVSDKPASGFRVIDTTLVGLPDSGEIDPCIFTDDDGQAYFYYGGGGHCYGAKLKENMIELDGALKSMTGLSDFHEGTWVFKRNGIYYLTYADNNAGGNQLRYAMSSNPLGPWSYKGVYLSPTTSDTSHGSVVEYNGQWWAFYHTADLSGTGLLRCICVDSLFFNLDGTIKMVKQTKDQGFPYNNIMPMIPGTIEAENYNQGGQGIAYWDNTNGNGPNEYRRSEDVDIARYRPANMYYVTDMSLGEYINYTFEVLNDDVYTINFVIGTPQSGQTQKFYLEFDNAKTSNPKRYDVSYTTLTSLGTVTVPNIKLNKGIHTMRFMPQGNMNFDKFTFTGTTSAVENVKISSTLVSPNPARDGIFSVKNIQINALATVSDVSGKIILKKALNQQDNTLDLSRYARGIYFLKLQTNEIIYETKLINK